jgi:hypothetical protein
MRNRNWVLAGVLVLAVVAAGIIAGHGRQGAVDRPRVSFGSRVSFASGVQKLGATRQLIYTNGWVATTGQQSIGVYAGRQRLNPRNGLFVILRQTGRGHQRRADVVVHGSGTVTLLRPAAPATEQAAYGATLHFVTANGGTGTLELGGAHVSLSH